MPYDTRNLRWQQQKRPKRTILMLLFRRLYPRHGFVKHYGYSDFVNAAG